MRCSSCLRCALVAAGAAGSRQAPGPHARRWCTPWTTTRLLLPLQPLSAWPPTLAGTPIKPSVPQGLGAPARETLVHTLDNDKVAAAAAAAINRMAADPCRRAFGDTG